MEHISCFLGCLVYLIGFSSSEVDADDGILLKGPDIVEWSHAEQTCQKNNGKLFKPNKTSFDVSLFSECNFNEDLWVDATGMLIIYSESAFRDSNYVIWCEMCTIGEKCGPACLFMACGNRCRAVCDKAPFVSEPNKHVLSDNRYNWTEANQWCSENVSTYSKLIQDGSFLCSVRYDDAGCFWTRNVIKVQIQAVTGPFNTQDHCGILHNGTLSFTSCSTHLRPLCERVSTNTLETSDLYFIGGNNSCRLINSKKTSITTQISRRSNGTNAAIITSSTYGASTDASLFVPAGSSPHKSENGVLIGGVVGAGVVLTIIVIIVVVLLLRRSKKNRNRNSNLQGAVNHDNVLKAKSYVNDAYDDVNGEVTYADKQTSIQMQDSERESITYANPSNVKGYSEIIRDNNSGIITNGEQTITVLYSTVQKRLNTGQNLHNTNQSAVGDDDYDKINFDKSYTQQVEHQGDVYDQTSVNCENGKEYFENVYNKEVFYHKRQNMDAGDVYDKANFHGGQQDKRNENALSDEVNASPYQISENIYDKADFHRRPQDESNGYL